MRHHGRANDADRDVERSGVGDDLTRGNKAAEDGAGAWRGQYDLDRKADEDHDQQRDNEGFQRAEAALHQEQDEKCVRRRDERPDDQRNAEEQIERDRRADHLGEVAGNDRRLAGEPERNVDRARVMRPAGLSEIAIRGDAEPRRERLQQDRHQVREQDDGEQRVAEFRAAGEIGRPIAGVHVADGNEVARPSESEEAAQPMAGFRDDDARVEAPKAELLPTDRARKALILDLLVAHEAPSGGP